MGEITPHHIQQLQQLLPQMHAQTQNQNQYMWPPQAQINPEPAQINSSGGRHKNYLIFLGYKMIHKIRCYRISYLTVID